MIHFLPVVTPRLAEKIPEMLKQVDVLLGNFEDAIPVDRKVEAREGFIQAVKDHDFGTVGCWVRVNALDSPWFLDDMFRVVEEIGNKVDVVLIPKVLGPQDIQYVDRLLAQLEARFNVTKPILVHAILETGGGVAQVDEIALASPRMQGMSFGPADLAASRRMKTTRVGGGHPFYLVRSDPDAEDASKPRVTAQQDPWHYSIARMVDACVNAGIYPYYGPFGDIADTTGCEDQFRAAFLLGCVGAWSLHPVQIEIARRVFSPAPNEVKTARAILDAMPDGSGVVMLDGKMQDDATWKQAKVMWDLAMNIAKLDSAMAEEYGIDPATL
jgi:malyl-CoA/(S)-citramalyl-CoA lyase